MPTGTLTNPAFAQQLLDALDALSGLHPGFRPVHAKGLMCSGTFTPSPQAANLTRAPHASRPSTAVTVRYSNATGVPTIPDNDPARSGPRGIAIRFHLAEHVHTDIVANSTDGFPVRTGEEFLEFLRAPAAFGAGRPEALGVFVQLAAPGDDVADASVPWPDSRPEIPFGTITLTARVDDQAPERRSIIFDPVPRVEGIESSGDPLTDVRSDIYLLSGRRRRAVFGDGRR
jgi:catalase